MLLAVYNAGVLGANDMQRPNCFFFSDPILVHSERREVNQWEENEG